MAVPIGLFDQARQNGYAFNQAPEPDLAASLALFDPVNIWAGFQQLTHLQQRQKAKAALIGRVLKRRLSRIRSLVHRKKSK
ncbi:hypothetical protein [Hymenobacter oligotrophus]|nr:hypothetical protein [Hymenobacter oligotrophus]